MPYSQDTEHPQPGQAKTGQWGPPIAPIKGQGKCTHKRPRKRRNRVCRECGYYTIEQARRGGIRSGMMRRFNSRKRDSRIRNLKCKRGLGPTAIARLVGCCRQTVYNVLGSAPFWKVPVSQQQQPDALGKCLTNIISQVETTAVRPYGARVKVAKWLFWQMRVRQMVADAPDQRVRAVRQRQLDTLKRSLSQYRRAVGVDLWGSILAASQLWLDRLIANGGGPLPELVKHTR